MDSVPLARRSVLDELPFAGDTEMLGYRFPVDNGGIPTKAVSRRAAAAASSRPRTPLDWTTRYSWTGRSMPLSAGVLVIHQQIHQSYLVEHFSVFDVCRLGIAPGRMLGAPHLHNLPGQLAAPKRGLVMVYGMIQAQASMLAFNDIYRLMLWITVIAIPPLLLLWLWQNSKVVRTPSAGAAALARHLPNSPAERCRPGRARNYFVD
jgi:hypothetical protein